jgi:hypothetical protein
LLRIIYLEKERKILKEREYGGEEKAYTGREKL